MENRARIAMASNRKIVQDGLDRRRMESQLDAFEEQMIQRVNENCDNANWQRKFDDTARLDMEAINARVTQRAESKTASKQVRQDTRIGCLIFLIYSIVITWLTSWTHLPVWAAVMYIAAGAFFLVLYLIDVHGLLSKEDEE